MDCKHCLCKQQESNLTWIQSTLCVSLLVFLEPTHHRIKVQTTIGRWKSTQKKQYQILLCMASMMTSVPVTLRNIAIRKKILSRTWHTRCHSDLFSFTSSITFFFSANIWDTRSRMPAEVSLLFDSAKANFSWFQDGSYLVPGLYPLLPRSSGVLIALQKPCIHAGGEVCPSLSWSRMMRILKSR